MSSKGTIQLDLLGLRSLSFDPYSKVSKSTRSGPIFRLHPYPTKINYRSIIPFILAHTKPQDVVYDCFAGTCSTAFAAAACAQPEEKTQTQFGLSNSQIEWGPRKAICIDIGVLPTFIGRSLLNPVDVEEFRKCVIKLLNQIEEEWGWLYEALDEKNEKGIIRYTFLSSVIQCSKCSSEIRFIDLFVDFETRTFLSENHCPNCGTKVSTNDVQRSTEVVYDNLLKANRIKVKRVPVRVFGKTDGRNWNREFNEKDMDVLERIDAISLSDFVKPIPMLKGGGRWGEMFRSGYHQDVAYVHDFYTKRNFLALAILYNAVELLPKEFRDHYLLLVSSYNASHSSLMTRFVFKKSSEKPVVTSAQPGTLYISNCPVEKNVFLGVQGKLKKLCEALDKINEWNPKAEIYTRPAQDSGLRENSVDYIFTDPPFGHNIQYSELNFLSEVWLSEVTDSTYETLISKAQKKDLASYEKLLCAAFAEGFRVLKPGRYMTVVFHNVSKDVWNALHRAILNAGFEIVKSSILDKTQTSFKQTTTKGAVRRDPIILAYKPFIGKGETKITKCKSPESFLAERFRKLDENSSPSQERTFDYLYSRYIGSCMTSANEIAVSARDFRSVLERFAKLRNDKWYLRGSKA